MHNWADGGLCWCNCGVCSDMPGEDSFPSFIDEHISVAVKSPWCDELEYASNPNLDCYGMCYNICIENGYCYNEDALYWKCRCYENPQVCTEENKLMECPCQIDGSCELAAFCCGFYSWGIQLPECPCPGPYCDE